MNTLNLKPFRRAAVPILAVPTADPAAVLRAVVAQVTNGTTPPILQWDCVHGIRPVNTEAQTVAVTLNQQQDSAIATGNPLEALRAAEQLGRDGMPKSVIVFFGLAPIMTDPQAGPPTLQALWNLRDVLPATGAMALITVPLGWRNPLPNDIATSEDPLPDRAQLAEIVRKVAADASLPAPAVDVTDKAADALIGLSAFAAEQATALSVSKAGVDVTALWTRKRQQVSATPGLTIYAGQERFADLGGLDQAKAMFTRYLAGPCRPGAVVFIDEIEKALAGGTGDTSGVSQSILGYLLSYMQDNAATGAIFIGPPGAAKSALAKAIGNEAQIPTVQLDLGACKGSLVGESEARAREALAVITAISAGKPLFVSTCNSIAQLPPELRRRFALGTLFFDLPTAEERAAIWPIWLRRQGLPEQEIPAADGWTGAEIAACCRLAQALQCPLTEASAYIVPVAVAAHEAIQRLRQEASGRYLNAGAAGLYQAATTTATAAGRRVEV